MTTQHQELLDELGRRLEARGFGFSKRAFFAPSGIFVTTPPRRSAPETETRDGEYTLADVWFFDRSVHLLPSGDAWEVRVTPHGGPHWVRRAATLDELESVAVEALGTSTVPPSPEWRVADDWLD
ncbi:hypothetical protein [Myxococcus faecalis]|uniref:hypothetical protein n=1 Tax=Myxococcus faecalis TaxID=3115646 RepID=UPI003CE86680